MKTYLKICIIAMLGIIMQPIMAQTTYLEYTYDLNGNRETRNVLLLSSKSMVTTNQDTTGKNDANNASLTDKTNPLLSQEMGRAQVVLYPNPTQGMVTLKINGLANDVVIAIHIYNTEGTLLWSKQRTGQEEELNFDNMTVGNYFVKVQYDDFSTTFKVVKQ